MQSNIFSKKKYKDLAGFTLIEIIIVISIIVLMVTIAIASFNTTRSRANDGNIKQQLGLMRLEAEKSYKLNRDSTSVCADTNFLTQKLPTGTVFKCVDGTAGFAFEAVLSTGEYYCVDFFGRERTNTNTAIVQAGPNCNGSADCDCR